MIIVYANFQNLIGNKLYLVWLMFILGKYKGIIK